MEKEDVSLLIRLLRASRGWSQGKLGAKVGVEKESIMRFEKGTLKPADATVERVIAAVGLPVDLAISVLPPVIRLLRKLTAPDASRPRGSGLGEWEPEVGLLEENLQEDLKATFGAALGTLAAALAVEDHEIGASGDSSVAAAARELPTLTERLCNASVRAAARSASDAVELARLAVQAAQDAEGSDARRARLEGWARGFLFNSLRVSGQLHQADAEINKAWKLWQEGQGGDPEGLLPEWRLLDLEASVRRDQMRTADALALLDRARAAAPAEAHGRLLLKTASTLEQAGDVAGSLRVLQEAVLQIGEHGDLREKWCVVFNLAVNLCHLGRFEEARECLDEARNLALELGNDLDSLRVAWLGARVDAGLGRSEQARAGLAAVRDQLVRGRDALDAGVVSLELAVMDLAAGRTAEVKQLAGEMAWIFAAEGIERDVVAALRLFCEAALQERATVAEAQELLARFEQRGPLRHLGEH
jgi:tetratricopeptide (TPR) repeat protein/DNA-binding XRE family transcriptional regulator